MKQTHLWPFWKAGPHRAECAFLRGGRRESGRQHAPSPFSVASWRGVRDRCTILSCSTLHWKHQPEEGQRRVFYNAKDISTSFISFFFGLFRWALQSALINFSVNVKTLAYACSQHLVLRMPNDALGESARQWRCSQRPNADLTASPNWISKEAWVSTVRRSHSHAYTQASALVAGGKWN